MRISRDAKNKLPFIDGSLPRPLDTDSTYHAWSRCNALLKIWILNVVSPNIYRTLLRLDDASAIWQDLQSRFHMTNLPRTFNLTKQIQDLRQGTMTLSEYYTTLRTLWDQLESAKVASKPCTCGTAASIRLEAENTKIVKFLAGLNESYDVIRRQIIMKKVLPSLSEIYQILDQDDSQKSFSNIIPSAAFQMTHDNIGASSIRPTRSDDAYNPSAAYYVQNGSSKGRPFCSYCKRPGHTADRCYKKHGFPPTFQPKPRFPPDRSQRPWRVENKDVTPLAAQVTASHSDTTAVHTDFPSSNDLTKEQIQSFIAYFSSQLQGKITQAPSFSLPGPSNENAGMILSSSAYCLLSTFTVSKHSIPKHLWIIDSCATNHIAHDASVFLSLERSIESSVHLPTGLTVKIQHVGTVQLNDHRVLQHVFFIPDFCLNLLSISALTTDLGVKVSFDSSCCYTQDHINGLMTGLGNKVSNLYVIEACQPTQRVNAVADIGIWHQRLGHPFFAFRFNFRCSWFLQTQKQSFSVLPHLSFSKTKMIVFFCAQQHLQ